jgi:hypothetical protein
MSINEELFRVEQLKTTGCAPTANSTPAHVVGMNCGGYMLYLNSGVSFCQVDSNRSNQGGT